MRSTLQGHIHGKTILTTFLHLVTDNLNLNFCGIMYEAFIQMNIYSHQLYLVYGFKHINIETKLKGEGKKIQLGPNMPTLHYPSWLQTYLRINVSKIQICCAWISNIM